MGCGFPTLRRGYNAVRIHHNIIFIKTRRLLPLHLQLVRPRTLILEQYALMFSPEHGLRGACKTLLHYSKFKDWPRINVLGHTVVTAGDVLPNCLQHRIRQHLTNGGYSHCTLWYLGIWTEIQHATKIFIFPTPERCRVL